MKKTIDKTETSRKGIEHMEKTILIVCGTGVASSAIMSNAVQELLERNKLESKVIHCRYSQMKNYLPQADLVIASLTPPEKLERPVIVGTGFLTGIGIEKLEEDILRQLCPA